MAEGPDAGRYRVVVGVDGSAHSEKALQWAAHLTERFGADLVAVSAWDYPAAIGWATVPADWHPDQDMEKVLQETLHKVFGNQPPARLHLVVREGGAAKVLLEESKGATMLVVGSRGHGGFAGLLLGSVSANVAEHAPCPVLVVHGHEGPPPGA
ncbi:MAG: universal stress protein, partial [Streptosporangiaceae bacterium]